jgi:NADH-quinone oxidoreductase subunit A
VPTDYYVNHGVVALVGVVALLFAAATLAVWRLLRPSRPTREKLLIYECGIDRRAGIL